MLSGDTVGGTTACYFGRHVSTDAGQSNLAHVCDGMDDAFFDTEGTALPEFQALVLQPQMELTNLFALIDKQAETKQYDDRFVTQLDALHSHFCGFLDALKGKADHCAGAGDIHMDALISNKRVADWDSSTF